VYFVLSLAIEEMFKKDKQKNKDKGLDMNSVQAGAPEESDMTLNNGGKANERGSNGKTRRGWGCLGEP
jgi:hypothetical protein